MKVIVALLCFFAAATALCCLLCSSRAFAQVGEIHTSYIKSLTEVTVANESQYITALSVDNQPNSLISV